MECLRLQVGGYRAVGGKKRMPIRFANGKHATWTRTIYRNLAGAGPAQAADAVSYCKGRLTVPESESCMLELAGTGENVSMGDILLAYAQSCMHGGPDFPYPVEDDNSLALDMIHVLPVAGGMPSSGMSGCTQQTGAKGDTAWQKTAKQGAMLFCSGSPGTGRKYLPQDNDIQARTVASPEKATPLFWAAGLEQAVARTLRGCTRTSSARSHGSERKYLTIWASKHPEAFACIC